MLKKRKTEDFILVLCAYNPSFVAKAKNLGGKWVPETKEWKFPAEVESHVDSLVLDIYGEQFGVPTEKVTLKCTVEIADGYKYMDLYHEGFTIAGRSVAYARGRDSGAKLGEKVALLSGKFGSGGSVKNWTTAVFPGTVFEIYDVPLAAAEKEIADPSYDGPAGKIVVEIVKPETPATEDPAKSALLKEKSELLTRLAEIEAELTKTAKTA